jgi:hypothetical protein
MNSLTELNGFVNSFNLTFTDVRLSDVTFDRPLPVNQNQTVDRGFTISASVGYDIVEIINAALSTPTYNIDVSGLAGATVSWASLPSGVTVTNTAAGIYVVSGFADKTQWDLIKSPTIDFADDYFGTWTYTSSISYYSQIDGGQTKSWSTGVTVNNVLLLTTPSQFVYTLSAVSAITGVPLLGNLDASYPSATFTVVITPSSISSINTFTTTGTGGSFSVNGSTKVVTISGTRTQVNSRLSGLRIDANSTAIDFVLNYAASNNQNGVTDTKSQILISQGLSILGLVSSPTIYYTEDVPFTISGAPLITDIPYDGTGTYTYLVTPSTTAAVSTMAVAGSGGTTSFNNSTKVLTIQGTRSEVNGRLTQITVTPAPDYDVNFNLNYSVSTPRADTANKIQIVAISGTDTEITNMNITRSYVSNSANLIFSSNTPVITDTDPTNPIYSIVFDCPNGAWTRPQNFAPLVETEIQNPLTITGTKTFVNEYFIAIRFYPNAGVSSNTTFTYTQIKNNVTQLTQTVGLTGTYGAYSNTRTVEINDSQTFTPTPIDVRYGKMALLLVGGGGGGGSRSGGGGGGAEVNTWINQTMLNQTYTAVIGAGGTGGASEGIAGTAGGNTTFSTSGQTFSVTGGGGGGGFSGGLPPTSYGNGANSGPYFGGLAVLRPNNPNSYFDVAGGGGAGQGGNGQTPVINASYSVTTAATGGVPVVKTVTLNGSNYTFAMAGGNTYFSGGGGGGITSGVRSGGITGAGLGGRSATSTPATAATLPGGGGGGGASGFGGLSLGASGFKGIVIIRIYGAY